MKLSDFDYKFPEELVAQRPLADRTASRMFVLEKNLRVFRHLHITDIINFIKEGDIIVFNDTRVFPARIFGEKSGGKPIELLLTERIEGRDNTDETWRCVTKRVRSYRKGDKLFFGISAAAEVAGRDGDFLIVNFKAGHRKRAVEKRGVPPLPPYIKRKNFNEYTDEDRERYQTVYAANYGSAAAPTAGLHFSGELIGKIKSAGVQTAFVTLHVGADTFAPVRAENIEDHKMHGEHFIISEETAEKINTAKKEKRRIIAVGTTTVRALESAGKSGAIVPGEYKTNLFITPGYEFKITDAMLTNFHQPKSTLIMLVSAFAGRELILNAYKDAIKNRYRLFSYGDCMLII
jgi:S-adenosylmethionine:tRNA ribosyltransferase-isomerase